MSMSDINLIRAASSKWLRDNEGKATRALAQRLPRESNEAVLKRRFSWWSDWQVNNMLSFLALVKE